MIIFYRYESLFDAQSYVAPASTQQGTTKIIYVEPCIVSSNHAKTVLSLGQLQKAN